MALPSVPIPSFALVAAGTTMIGASRFAVTLGLIGAVLAVAGIAIAGWAQLTKVITAHNRPADHAYGEGYEAGYDKGWRDGRARPTLTVIHGERAGGADA